MLNRYTPRRPSSNQKAAATSFQSGTTVPPAMTEEMQAEWLRSDAGQAAMTADSMRAVELADKARFAALENAQEQAAYRSDPDFRNETQFKPAAQPRVTLRPEQRAIHNPQAFVLAGNATFTLVSKATGSRFTFKVRQPEAGKPHFVSLLTGSDNENSYTFLGTIFADGSYRHGRRSSIGPEAPSAKAFAWFYANVGDTQAMAKVEVYHEGRCCRCGRKLTVPSSIESGIGPECATK